MYPADEATDDWLNVEDLSLTSTCLAGVYKYIHLAAVVELSAFFCVGGGPCWETIIPDLFTSHHSSSWSRILF